MKQSKVKYHNQLSEKFECSLGIQQGESLSLVFIFNVFK